MKLAQRYLAAHFIPPFILGTIFFVSFLLIFQLFRLVSIVINKSVPWMTTLELIFHTAVSFLPMAYPLASLFAAIYTLNKMSEDSEIVVMRAMGMRKGQLFFPFLVIGTLIAISIYSLNAQLIPHSRSTFQNTIIRLTSQGALTDIRSEVFFTEIPRLTLFAQNVFDDATRMEEVFIHLRDREASQEQVIHAKRGALVKQSQGEWRAPSVRMFLEEGNIVKMNQETGDVEKVLFEEYDFPVMAGDLSPHFVTKDSMMSNEELRAEIARLKKRLLKDKTVARALYETEMEYWTRINTPFQCLIFIFLGFSMGIKKGRGAQNKLSSVMSILALLGYYIIFFTAVSFVNKGQLSPVLAVFMPTALVLAIGIYYYRKLDWNS